MNNKMLSIFTLIIGLGFTHNSGASQPCVKIYFDQVEDHNYVLGRTYSIFLQNLLGHFPHYQQIVTPISQYKKQDLEECKANFYIGSHYDSVIPKDFLLDAAKTKKSLLWMGYNIWRLPENELVRMTGHRYSRLTTLDSKITDSVGNPGFYKYVHYKGEVFEKFGEWAGEPKIFHAAFEMVGLEKISQQSESQVLAFAEHSGRRDFLPYLIRNKNFFYLADIPFSYIHEADRYLIFSDILFDVLGEKPRHQERLAFLRIEDVHPKSALPELHQISDLLYAEEVPENISLIPIFFDPLNNYNRQEGEDFVTLNDSIPFQKYLEKIKARRANFIWHGVTHQYGKIKNPHSGYSSDDFEFWNAVDNTAVKEDGSSFVLNRLDFGYSLLQKAGIMPQVWLTPHYQASALDYLLFARVFPWSIGRVIYFDFNLNGITSQTRHEELVYGPNGNARKRKDFFKELQVSTRGQWNGQFFPYEIYGDLYGHKLLPENLGNPQPFKSNHVVWPRQLEKIVADAKRNLVIRDSWASLFFHPYLLQDLYNDGIGSFPGDVEPLRKTIRELKKLGYRFISASEFIDKNNDSIRSEPIYRFQREKK